MSSRSSSSLPGCQKEASSLWFNPDTTWTGTQILLSHFAAELFINTTSWGNCFVDVPLGISVAFPPHFTLGGTQILLSEQHCAIGGLGGGLAQITLSGLVHHPSGCPRCRADGAIGVTVQQRSPPCLLNWVMVLP